MEKRKLQQATKLQEEIEALCLLLDTIPFLERRPEAFNLSLIFNGKTYTEYDNDLKRSLLENWQSEAKKILEKKERMLSEL